MKGEVGVLHTDADCGPIVHSECRFTQKTPDGTQAPWICMITVSQCHEITPDNTIVGHRMQAYLHHNSVFCFAFEGSQQIAHTTRWRIIYIINHWLDSGKVPEHWGLQFCIFTPTVCSDSIVLLHQASATSFRSHSLVLNVTSDCNYVI